MKILVLGGHGMAGHVLVDYLQSRGHQVKFTLRNSDGVGIGLDVRDLEKVKKIILQEKPGVLINAVGILNNTAEKNVQDAIIVNSLLPHVLAETLNEYGGKLIHVSTDCVFSGEKGGYTENDVKDGTNVYSKTKSLGEVTSVPHLTVRTSIIGPELKQNGIGLLHWFSKQEGEIKGYENVYWNGVTTLELSKAIEMLIIDGVSGLYQLCSKEKISKYHLLLLFKEIFDRKNVNITAVKEPKHDRTLIHTRNDYYYPVKDYSEMLKELSDWMNRH
ncbi:SDR family oxidoreductase [Bacillus haikouensis]|uniref:dTDP-4-dehydrorhamnose reductase family protein n=1 Tax=Bacillus haikouensis TaxID=1510468 RepID=UPI001554EF4C|nr:SDR family oxidoreductase [Bacillus haikouensis]NQD64942.1 SDR family oxidoreductase [Bacillus haikouensis]